MNMHRAPILLRWYIHRTHIHGGINSTVQISPKHCSTPRPPCARQVYNEHKPRLAVSGWFHAALPSEMGDWPDHTLDDAGIAAPEGDKKTGATSTLEQLKGAAGDGGGGLSGGDGSDCAAFTDDFEGAQVGRVSVYSTVHACTARRRRRADGFR